MALQKLIGTDLDRIGQSLYRAAGRRVLLFDLYQDSVSDIVLDRYQQVPLDITAFVLDMDISVSHDTESNQASFRIAGEGFDWRWLLFSWVKVYEGDLRVDSENWPLVFSGVFRGQPSRNEERGNLRTYSHTAYDRSVFFRNRRHTSGRAWLPTDTDADVGEICRQFATNSEWGMGLAPDEVLFGKMSFRILQKLQIVDIPAMDALREIMQVARREPAFNGEGKLVARPLDLDRLPIRVYGDNDLIKSVTFAAQPANIPSAVTVRGLDYKLSRVDHRKQKMFTVGPITIGMFTPVITSRQSFDDNQEFRAVVASEPVNVQFEGTLLTFLFGLDDTFEIRMDQDGEFGCVINVRFGGAEVAIIIVVSMLAAYIALKFLGAELGGQGPFLAFLGWIVEAIATVLLFIIMQTLRSLGKLQFEVHGTPYEYAYLELVSKARLTDVMSTEEEPIEIENHILSTIEQVEDLARDELRRKAAEVAQRDLVIGSDVLLEPNDVLELDEEGETARYYVMEVSKKFRRGEDPFYQLSTFRAK